jgi:hypothetical protein
MSSINFNIEQGKKIFLPIPQLTIPACIQGEPADVCVTIGPPLSPCMEKKKKLNEM